MTSNNDEDRIQPFRANPAYWQYKGAGLLLLGGSVEDNLFQMQPPEALEEHLDALVSAGGNYVRCTMSSRDPGDVWPFAKDTAGVYDLRAFNPEYWRRLVRFLELTARRDAIVQLELWATFDYYRDCWEANPFNPKNNCNYTAAESGLPEAVPTHPTKTENNFFWSVPQENDRQLVLRYQRAFVDEILSCTLRFGHVLYCMDNETSVTPAWGAYWSGYVRSAAARAGVGVETTEMWDPWDLAHPMHAHTFEHPETYSFVDISQNNHNSGRAHWQGALGARRRVAASGRVRPINNVKVYGADSGRFGDDRDGQERFWRNVFAGCASTRFHRPDSGLGLSPTARAHIKSLRMLTDSFDLFGCAPGDELLRRRGDTEAYCLAKAGAACAVFFADGGEAVLDASALTEGRSLSVRWLDVPAGRWAEPVQVAAGPSVRLAPGRGFRAGLVNPQ